jgi:hypothetical protein
MQVVGKPTRNTRLFVQAAYRQVFNHTTGAFRKNEPVWRLSLGGDVQGEGGWMASLRAFYTSSYQSNILDPGKTGLEEVTLSTSGNWLVNARLVWKLNSEPFQMHMGVELFNLLDNRFREQAGVTKPNGRDAGGERLARRIVLFVQGQL